MPVFFPRSSPYKCDVVPMPYEPSNDPGIGPNRADEFFHRLFRPLGRHGKKRGYKHCLSDRCEVIETVIWKLGADIGCLHELEIPINRIPVTSAFAT